MDEFSDIIDKVEKFLSSRDINAGDVLTMRSLFRHLSDACQIHADEIFHPFGRDRSDDLRMALAKARIYLDT